MSSSSSSKQVPTPPKSIKAVRIGGTSPSTAAAGAVGSESEASGSRSSRLSGNAGDGSAAPTTPQGVRAELPNSLPNSGHFQNKHLDLSHLQSTFKSSIVGDLFGSNLDSGKIQGMMYRARVVENQRLPNIQDIDERSHDETDLMESMISSNDERESDEESENEFKNFKTMNPKQQLALTIKNWSASARNDEQIIAEGGVQALIALCHVEDVFIRRCCASTFNHLSERIANRHALLQAGATNGVVLCLQGSPPRCSWKVARLCALSLCFLSMELAGEARMANENATVALVQLSTYQGTALMPICIQALYNMTCTSEFYKGVERIIKAFLNLSASSFDHSVFLVRALINCARYSWLRLRIIEDGALTCLNLLLQALPTNENRVPLTFDILTALRSLSDSAGCRADMLSKGAVDMLNNLLPYCDERGKLQIMKILHNFLQAPPSAMNNTAFETTVLISTLIAGETRDPVTVQYCSACFHIITREHIRGMRHLALNIIDSMSLLLICDDPLTQFFAISCSGNLFFHNLCDNPHKVEQLVLNFVQHGPGIQDPAANQALALALAKLSQEPSYMAVIEKLQLLNDVLELLLKLLDLHKNSLLLQESCCIAICRIALKMEVMNVAEKQRIADVFLNMLETDDQYVLQSTISSIRALGSSGLCPKQLLSEMLLSRIATIVGKYKDIIELCRLGCAVLAVFSYDVEAHDLLAAENIMQVLFDNINTEDGVTKELVATSLCNVSVNSHASKTMIQMGVVEVLASLSSSTSESILELCAKCVCNLTCSIGLHPKMVQQSEVHGNNVMEIILMIALVRTVSNNTKLICAKALLNLVTDDNLQALEQSGVVRVFATLSTVQYGPIQQICSKGFYLLSLNTRRRQVMVKSRMVLQSLFNMVKTHSSRIKVRVGTAVCNFLSCAQTNKAAIGAGALSVLKIVGTMDFEELREATARVIINLACDDSLQALMLQQPLVEILVLTLHQSADYTFECAIMALSCLSHSKVFQRSLIERGGVTALISTIITAKVKSPVIAEEVCRCLCHLSYSYAHGDEIIASGHLTMALFAIYLTGLCSADNALLMALTLRNISEAPLARKMMMKQDAFKLIVSLICDFTHSSFKSTIMYSALVTLVFNLSMVPELHMLLVEQGVMLLLKKVCLCKEPASGTAGSASVGEGGSELSLLAAATAPQYATRGSSALRHNVISETGGSLLFRKDRKQSVVVQLPEEQSFSALLHFTHSEVALISKTLNLLSQSAACHSAMVDGGVMQIIKALIIGLAQDGVARGEVASALANLTGSKQCREPLVQQDAVELLIALSYRADSNTQSLCALALGYLSELTKVNDGVVSSLLTLSIGLEEHNSANPDGAVSSLIHGRRSADGHHPAVMQAADAKDVLSQLQKAADGSATAAGTTTSAAAAVVAAAAAAANQSPPQTLTSLLKGVLLDKTKFDQYVQALDENNFRNVDASNFVAYPDEQLAVPGPTVATANVGVASASLGASSALKAAAPSGGKARLMRSMSKLQVNELNASVIVNEEKAVLQCNFNRYQLGTSESNDCYESESGGMSQRLLMELPLPGIPEDRDLDPVDRHTELVRIIVSEEPLPKDGHTPHSVIQKAPSADQSEKNPNEGNDNDVGNLSSSDDEAVAATTSSAALNISTRRSRSTKSNTSAAAAAPPADTSPLRRSRTSTAVRLNADAGTATTASGIASNSNNNSSHNRSFSKKPSMRRTSTSPTRSNF